ncbi:protease, partial [Streptomyces sp. NPDC057115]
MPRPASAAPAGGPAAPPPPRASARFPDAPPVVGGPGTRRTPADGTGDGGRPGGAEDTAPVPPPPAH